MAGGYAQIFLLNYFTFAILNGYYPYIVIIVSNYTYICYQYYLVYTDECYYSIHYCYLYYLVVRFVLLGILSDWRVPILNLTIASNRHVHEYVSSRCGKSTQPIRFKFCTEVWLFCVNHNLSPGCVIRVRKIQFHKKIDLEQNASIIAQYRSDRSELKIVRLN